MSQRKILQDFIAGQKISLSAVSRGIGISSATLSLWVNDKYKGDNSKVEHQVNSWLQRQSEKRRHSRFQVKFAQTTVASKVHGIARLAHLDGEICVCTGEAGLGKTVAIHEYVKDNPGSILIEADYGYTTRVLFSVLYKELFDLPGKGNLHDMFTDCVSKLSGSERLIIVDEAENLPYRALELLRRLNDKAGVGILLVGMPRLIENIRGQRREFAQLYSRVGGYLRLSDISIEDAAMIVKQHIPSANGLVKEFYTTARQNPRTMSKLVYRTVRAAEIEGVNISEDLIHSTYKMLVV